MDKSVYKIGGYLEVLGVLAWFGATIFVLLNFRGTYDSGDSVQHFVNASYAGEYPHLFLDHWGKPFFTLAAYLPASLGGMVGMKIFNCVMILLAALAANRIAKILIPQMRGLAALFVVAAPDVFCMQFSGLTEPMFAAVLGISAATVLEGNYKRGFVYASFLPFVRTEGFLLLPVFALYALLKWWRERRQEQSGDPLAQWNFLQLVAWGSLLLVGTVAYSLVGAYHYDGDLLWVFNQNPYATDADNYGIGTWDYFFKNYIFIVGVPLYGLWLLGWLASGLRLLTEWTVRDVANRPLRFLSGKTLEWMLVMGLFIGYFGAHVVFWATGTAHSMGLLRVLVALAPLGALISLRGLQLLVEPLRRWPIPRLVLLFGIPLYVIVFPFTPNPTALHKKDFTLTTDQALLRKIASAHLVEGEEAPLLATRHPYAAVAFDRDPFSKTVHLRRILQNDLPPGSLVLWDGWFGVTEAGIPFEYWEENAEKYVLLQEEKATSPEGVPIHMLLFRVQ